MAKPTFYCPNWLLAATVITAVITASCVSSGSRVSQPEWVRDPYRSYNQSIYVSAVGNGTSRQTAERNALAQLVAVFGQSIYSEQILIDTYLEILGSRSHYWTYTGTFDSALLLKAGMDTLVGAEIRDVWENRRGVFFAVAVINKANAARLYGDMLYANRSVIDNLIAGIPAEQRNTFNTLARYQYAAVIADVNAAYANVLSVVGSPVQGLRSGSDFRREIMEIRQEIPVALNVTNDNAGRQIQDAFARSLSGIGFASGGHGSRYILNVNVIAEPAEIANARWQWTRIEISATLTDTAANTVLLPYNFNVRGGAANQSQANNGAYTIAAQRIATEYADLLRNYLSRLVPVP